MKYILSIHWILIALFWYMGNGIYKIISVLKRHTGNYTIDLQQQLMNGYFFIVAAIILFVCYLMILNKIQCGALISIIISIAILINCVMVFPFQKPVISIVVSLIIIVVAYNALNSFPNIYDIMQKYK